MPRALSPHLLATASLTLGLVSAWAAVWPPAPVHAAGAAAIAVEKQNDFVKTHCAVCHNDRAKNGGLSLEGFDGARVAPSLAAMMLSKMTSGTALATRERRRARRRRGGDAGQGARTGRRQRGRRRRARQGDRGRPGVGVPAQSAGASKWSVERAKDRVTNADMVTASIVRELPSAAGAGRPADIEAAMYRLVLTCNATARDGEMQLAWSPIPSAARWRCRSTASRRRASRWWAPSAWGTAPRRRPGRRRSCSRASAAAPRASSFRSARSPPAGLFAGETVTFPFDS